jgi:uridine nucleosidase
VTEGTHDGAYAEAQIGRTIATPLEPGAEGAQIPRSLDVVRFWQVNEECLERADKANAGEATGL